MHYATKCIIASSECATLKDASSAGRVITVLLLVLVPCLFTGGLISKSAITTYCTLKCAKLAIAKLKELYDIEIGQHIPGSARSQFMTISTIREYRQKVAIPYLDQLSMNINNRFLDKAVKLLVATSIFNLSLLPQEQSLNSYGLQEITDLADFYGSEASVEFQGAIYKSSPLLDREELLSEWKFFRRAFYKEKELISSKNANPDMQEVFQSMQKTEVYKGIFPQTFKLSNIILAFPVGTATVERSFSDMKMIKTRLRNRLSDLNLCSLMRIAIEGPNLIDVHFEEILDVFKEKNRRIPL